MNTNKNLASYLRQYREKAELTQGELAQRLSISRQSVIALESGKCIPSVSLAIRIAHFFELPVEFIFRTFDENFETMFSEMSSDVEEKIEEAEGKDIKKRGADMQMPRGLMPWSPWKEMMNLRSDIDRFFEEPMTAQVGTFHPSVSIRETDKELVIEADLPGVKEEDVEVEIEDNKVIIRGERKFEGESKAKGYYHMESSYGSFSRIIGLPSYVNSSRANAEIKNGILEIKIPKGEQIKAKKIPLKKTTHSQSTQKKIK